MRYAFVARERTHYPVQMLCRVLQVSVSGFHGHQRLVAATAGPDKDRALRRELQVIHAASKGTYGRPRMVKALRASDYAVGPKRVARLMAEEGLRGKVKGSFKPRTTLVNADNLVSRNLLDRRFSVDSDVCAWVGDITSLATHEGWMYLATVISLKTRQVLGYSLADRMPEELVQQAFLNAWAASAQKPGIVFHSDRGAQYSSAGFRRTLDAHGVVQSMSRKGNCWDNAVAESFFATLKNEEANGVYASKDQAHRSVAAYIHGFYNPTRLHSALGYRSPNDYARQMRRAA